MKLKKNIIWTAAFCIVLGTSIAAWSVNFEAVMNGGVGLEDQMTFTLVTFSGQVDYDEQPMENQGDTWFVEFDPNPLATNWRVEATPVSWWENPVIIDLDDIDWQEINRLDEEFNYIGPLR